MPWFKVDDHLATHAKVLKAGNAAMGLWVRAGSWSALHLSNGNVPTHVLPTLGKPAEARRLVDAGLWEVTPEGWRFRDWHDYQPTAEKAEEVKEKRRAAGRMGGLASGKSRAKGNQE